MIRYTDVMRGAIALYNQGVTPSKMHVTVDILLRMQAEFPSHAWANLYDINRLPDDMSLVTPAGELQVIVDGALPVGEYIIE